MQVSGDSPTSLDPQLQGTIDLLNYLTLDRLRSAQQGTTVNITGVGTYNATIGSSVWVPQSEAWLVREISCQIGTAVPAATTCRFRAALWRASLTPAVFFAAGPVVSLAATELGQSAMIFETPIIMTPGDTVIFNVEAFTGAGPVTGAFINIAYSPIRI
jgi:hypothetical protein